MHPVRSVQCLAFGTESLSLVVDLFAQVQLCVVYTLVQVILGVVVAILMARLV